MFRETITDGGTALRGKHVAGQRIPRPVIPVAAGVLVAAVAGGTVAFTLVGNDDSASAAKHGNSTMAVANGSTSRDRLEQRASRGDARSTGSPSASPDQQSASLPQTGQSGSCLAGYVATGTVTASGEKFDPTALTGANLSLPFGSKVQITNAKTGQSVVIRINDRGPYAGNRCFDLTSSAYQRIASLTQSEITIEYQVLS